MTEPDSSVTIKVPKTGCLKCCMLQFAERLQACNKCSAKEYKEKGKSKQRNLEHDIDFEGVCIDEECLRQRGEETEIPEDAQLEPIEEGELLNIDEDDLNV